MTSTLGVYPQTESPGPRWVPRVDALTAARRYWRLVVALTVLLTSAGVAAALVQHPIYTAHARLAVGRIDVSAPGAVGGFAFATQALAAQYSRAIDAVAVTRPVARQTGLTAAEVASRLRASPIPQSPVIRVMADGTTPQEAVLLANAASEALVSFTTRLNRSNPDTARLLRQFMNLSRQVIGLGARVADLHRRQVANPDPVKRQRLSKARVDLGVAELEKQTVRTAYSASTTSQASTELLQILTPAETAASDRSKRLQLFGFIGFVVGLALALALATLRANAVVRRSLRS